MRILPAAADGANLIKANQLNARKKQLRFQRSKIHDLGLVALEPIEAEDFVIEYFVELIRSRISDIREQHYERMGIGSSYIFRLDDGYVPKCYTKVISVAGQKKIFIYAKRVLNHNLIEELGIHIVSFDRPGYGESDPNPNQTLQSSALDIEELADQLELGSKFYVFGFSMGSQAIWSCLKYIPHRLAVASLIAPVVNYWWLCLPLKLSQDAYSKQFIQDQWSLRVAHHLPSLTYWWNTQKLFPSYKAIAHGVYE
uniref:AB hydrolase-1 domain-containing protein n=1 Tax=Lactuca sativa TaxID=4236 RepID=A0A9R1W050_LACSA|nr:hypothetical protein LSAT_V11C400198140 [Lactuca sativa]